MKTREKKNISNKNTYTHKQHTSDHVHTVEKSSVRGDTLHTMVFCFIFDYDDGNEDDDVVDDNENAAKQTHTVYFNLSRWQTKKKGIFSLF